MPGWVGGVLVALCAGTVWGLMQYFTPVMVDDLVFVAQYLAANDGDGSFSLDALRRFALYNRLHDNFRIANMLAPFSTVISPWKELFPVFTGLAGAAMLWLSARLARGAVPGWRFASLAWLAVALFVPFRLGMFVRDFSLNYIYATAVSLGAFLYAVSVEKSGRWTPGRFLVAAVLLFISGGWHEGPGLCLVAGMSLWTLLRFLTRRPVSRQWMALTVLYAAAIALFLVCPGMVARAGREVGSAGDDTPWIYHAFSLAMVMLLGLALAVLLFFREPRRKLAYLFGSDAVFAVMTISAFSGALLSVFVVKNQRAAFWPEVCAIIAVLMLFRGAVAEIPRRAATLLCAGSLAVCAAQGAHAVSWQRRFWIEERMIMAMYRESANGVVFADPTMPGDVPYTTLSYPTKLLWVNTLHYHQFRHYRPDKYLAVIPGELAGANRGNSEALSSDSLVRRKGKSLFVALENDSVKAYCGASALVTADGVPVWRRIPLMALKYWNVDGEPMVYLRPFAIPSELIDSVGGLVLYPDCDPFRGDPADFRQRVARETGAPVKPH